MLPLNDSPATRLHLHDVHTLFSGPLVDLMEIYRIYKYVFHQKLKRNNKRINVSEDVTKNHHK